MYKSNALSELTSEEIENTINGKTVIWPIGGIEQHGPHLPLNVDSIIPDHFAQTLAAEIGGFTLPVQSISVRSLPQSGGGLAFPGTIFIDGSTFTAYMRRTISSLCCLPFKQLVIINGHYENESFIFEAIDELYASNVFSEKSVFAFSWWSLISDVWVSKHLPDFPGWHAEHAGITETSLMLYLRPELVRIERPDHETPPRSGIYSIPFDSASTSTRGVLSRTSGSSARLGKLIFEQVKKELLLLVNRNSAI